MAQAERVNGFEAVLFLEDQSVVRQMRYTEFEAVLDGVVPMTEIAEAEAKAVYVVIDQQLSIRALVFFTIYFDEDGRADSEWNLPLRRLARTAGPGPDLGGGPVRLACRSQCPISWHLADLWDPDISPGGNDFKLLKKAVTDNRLGFEPRSAKAAVNRAARSSAQTTRSSSGYNDVPAVEEYSNADADEDLSLSEELLAMPQNDIDAVDHKTRLARVLRDQRLRIDALADKQAVEVEDLLRTQRLEQQAHRNRVQILEQKLQQSLVLGEQLKKKLTARGEQILKLQGEAERQKAQMASLHKQLALIQKSAPAQDGSGDENQRRESRLQAELSIVKEQLERREAERLVRLEREEQLGTEMRALQMQLEDQDELAFVQQLAEQDVVFVVYHTGAGHLTLPLADLRTYQENPTAYAAGRCFVTEQHYRNWLEHNENPLCETCGATVERITVPADYEHGEDNRCAQHKPEF